MNGPGERSDRFFSRLVQYDNPLPQESIDMPPQMEARQHRITSKRSEKNSDFEQISRQMSSSSEESCPVVIPSGRRSKLEKQGGRSWWSRFTEVRAPLTATEEMVHMAFSFS